MNRPVRQRGMSLIEVMTAITLASLLLALGLPSFTTGMQNRQIRSAAEAVQNGLVYARTEALRRNRNVKFVVDANNNWTVGCDPEDTTIVEGQQACPALLQERKSGEGTAKALLASKLRVQGTGADAGDFAGYVRFTPLGRVASNLPSDLPLGNFAEYQVSNPTTGSCAPAGEMRCLSVRVTSTGQIRMCDPAVTVATDPRYCN